MKAVSLSTWKRLGAMTAIASLLTAFVFLFLLPQDTMASPRQDAAQTVASTIWQESFETDGVGSRYTVTEQCTDGGADYFTRTNGTNIGSYIEIFNADGSYFYAAMDTDGAPCTLATEVITFSTINISGYTNLQFAGLFAEDDSSDSNEDWDEADYVYVEYNIDNGGWTKVLQFASEPSATFNTEPRQDTNFDGNGDGTPLTPTFSDFIVDIAGSGASLDLRITTQLNSGDEDVAFDNFRIIHTPPSFEIGKSAPAIVAPSELFTYTLTVTNSTGITTTGTVITDVVPANATFASASDGGVESGGVVSWTVAGDFVADTSIERTFMVIADSTSGVDIVNADYGVHATEWITMAYGSPVTSTVSPLDLSIIKTGPAYGVISDTLVYTIMLINEGVANADAVIVTDTLPISTTMISSDMGIATNPAPGVYAWNLGTILSDTMETYYITVTVDADVASGTVLTNTIMATTSTVGDDLSNNVDMWETAVYPLISIYDIQQVITTTDPSPYDGQTVWVEGVVTAQSNEFNNYIIVEDPAGGAWSGLPLYLSGIPAAAEGDYLRAVGVVDEQFGLTHLELLDADSVQSMGTMPVPAPAVINTNDYNNGATAEQWESVYLEFQMATATNVLSFGEWEFNDSSGPALADDLSTSLTYAPVIGDEYSYIRGIGWYSFGAYKLAPRYDGDLGLGLSLTKDAPGLVAPGELFTYTITVNNQTTTELLGLVITDVVPANTTFAYALDGGVETSGVVSWSVTSLAQEDSISVSFAVTAIDQLATAVNDNYAVSASNHDSVVGEPVITHINDGLRIYHVQGEELVSPMLGQTVTVPGIVVADFQDAGMSGFYIQDAEGDNNVLTSDGIFVYHFATDVSLGELVTVTGRVAEYNQATQLTNVSTITHVASSELITPTTVVLPETVNGDLERYEGMLITIPQTMTVGQNYFQGRYGQVTLAADGRMFQPTNVYTPTSASAVALAEENARRLIILDDAKSSQNPDPTPYIGEDGTLRAGDTVTGLEGVLDEGLITSSSSGPIDYRLQPTTQVTFTRVNTRTDAPEPVDGNISVASFNVLNYFTTFGSRGADNQFEFDRQRTKIITAMLSIDADIVGLMEIENNATEAIGDLVDGLNAIAGAGTYAYIDSGIVGGDEIKVAMIYQPASVTPVGTTAVLTDTFPFNVNTRPPLAQAFATALTDDEFIVVVNHFKSKGSPCDSVYNPDDGGSDFLDPDLGDGQGNCNLIRVEAANVMNTWLDTDPTGTGSTDILVIGDLNAYAKEDPITTLEGFGYANLAAIYGGPWAYSYVFDGQLGYLDHALASPSMVENVTGTTHWHINADEPSTLDYNDYNLPYLYQPNAYRSSDHDPVVIGLSYLAETYLPIIMNN